MYASNVLAIIASNVLAMSESNVLAMVTVLIGRQS